MSEIKIDDLAQTPGMAPHLLSKPDKPERHVFKPSNVVGVFACAECGYAKYSLVHEISPEDETSFIPKDAPELQDAQPPNSVTQKTLEERSAPRNSSDKVGLKCTHNWVLIEPIDKPEETASGIAFTQLSNRKSNEGRVVAVGPGRREYRPDVAEANNILIAKYNADVDYYEKATGGTLPPESYLPPEEPTPPELADVFQYIPIDLNIGDRVLYLRWAGYAVDVDGRKLYAVEEHNVILVADDDNSDGHKTELQFWVEKH